MAAALAVPLVGLGLSTTAATTIATLGLYVATTAASIFLQMAMAEKTEQEIGTKLEAVLGGAVNQSIHMGRKETAGSFIYKGTWGRSGRVPNAYLVKVYCLSDRPVEGFEDYIWANGLKCNYDPDETDIIDGNNVGHPIPKFDHSGGHRLWVKFQDGNQNSADNYLLDKFGSGPRAWTEDHIGRGRALMIVTQKYDKKEPTGETEVIAVVKNSLWYDWRNDSTNGGSGSQRYDSYGTYGVNPGNPVTLAYNVMRGVYRGPEWLYGGQKWPATRFDNDTWTAAANLCDTDVSAAGGGTLSYARAGAEVDLSEEPWTVVERLMKSCNARMVESGGKFKIYVGGIGASVYSFTDGDVIRSEELTGKVFPTRDQIANTVNGTYVEPQNAGEAKAYKPRTKTEFVEEDGDVRKMTMDFDYVRDNRQAQRMARFALMENRRFRTFSVAFWSQARKLEPCDVVSWTSEEYQFTNKKFIVGDVVLRDDGIVILNLREADASDADWNALTDEDPFTTGVFEDLDEPTQSITCTVTAVPFTDDDGTDRRPAIRIEATLDDDFVDCEGLRYQVRKRYGDQKIIHRGLSYGFFDPDDPEYGDITFTSQSIATLRARWVQVRYKIKPESDRDTEWSDWEDHPINLDDLGIDDDDTSDTLLAAPTGLSVTKVQEKDQDGSIRTFLELDSTAAAWAGPKADYIYEIDVTGRPKPYRIKSGDSAARFRVNKTNVLHTIRARMKSGVGRLSAWTSSVSITPSKKSADASAITGIAIQRKVGVNIIKWDAITDPDNREVVIMRGTTNVLASMTEIGRTKGTRWRDDDNLTKGTRYYYRVLPVDTSDNIGVAASTPVDDVETGVVLTDTDTSTLGPPTGISLFQANRDLNADGTVDTALRSTFSGGISGAAGYEFQWLDSAGQQGGARADAGTAWFSAVTTRSYQVRWRTISWNGQAGSWSSYSGSVTPAATTGAPAAPASFTVTEIPFGVQATMNTPSELDYAYTEYAIRTSAGTPSTSDIFTSAVGYRSQLFLPPSPSTSWYIYARHVNTSGLRSGWTLASGSPITPMGGVKTNALGTSVGTINAPFGRTGALVVLEFKCTSNTAGVTINLGSTTRTVNFVDNQPMFFHDFMASVGGVAGGDCDFTKSGGGTFANARLTAIAI